MKKILSDLYQTLIKKYSKKLQELMLMNKIIFIERSFDYENTKRVTDG
jgi:hypothetical protein